MLGEDVELVAREHHPDEMPPYERLLADAMRGDPALFTREDTVEAAWEVVEPVLGDATPVHAYEPGTWGPPEAERLIAAVRRSPLSPLTASTAVGGPRSSSAGPTTGGTEAASIG
jgi:glucose-6-phosphate 1-dehydrogenase